jgi:hypothetical protein
MRACSPIVRIPVEVIVPSTSPSMSSSFRNLTEPLIETPRERRAPDCVGINVRLDSPGTTDGSGRFVCGGSVSLRGRKRSKGCMEKIVPNYLASREAESFDLIRLPSLMPRHVKNVVRHEAAGSRSINFLPKKDSISCVVLSLIESS